MGADESYGEAQAASPARFYVRSDGNDANNGLSWETALASISQAIVLGSDSVDAAIEVFVAEGTYFEKSGY